MAGVFKHRLQLSLQCIDNKLALIRSKSSKLPLPIGAVLISSRPSLFVAVFYAISLLEVAPNFFESRNPSEVQEVFQLHIWCTVVSYGVSKSQNRLENLWLKHLP